MDWLDFRLSKRLVLGEEVAEEFYGLIAGIDAVKGSWKLTGKLWPQSIERLKHSVIVTSTGSSNRIEGNRLSDQQVEVLYRQLHIKKFRTRDEQEVAGYLEMLERVFTHFEEIPVKESSILQLHRDMLRHSEKDALHLGQYKFGHNRVEAKDQSGNVLAVIFDPTPPHLVAKEMQELVSWYQWAVETRFRHPLLLTANFVFEYLAIHPFQDGNGRTSRLLTNLMLLQHGYRFTTLVSHERLVEANKADYYLALNKTQRSWKQQREDVSEWLRFFLRMLQIQAQRAIELLTADSMENRLSGKQLALWEWAQALPNGEFGRKAAIEALGYPARTVESIIKKLVGMKKLARIGEGRASRYQVIR